MLREVSEGVSWYNRAIRPVLDIRCGPTYRRKVGRRDRGRKGRRQEERESLGRKEAGGQGGGDERARLGGEGWGRCRGEEEAAGQGGRGQGGKLKGGQTGRQRVGRAAGREGQAGRQESSTEDREGEGVWRRQTGSEIGRLLRSVLTNIAIANIYCHPPITTVSEAMPASRK